MNASIPPRENLALLLSGGHPHNRIPVVPPPLDLFQALLLFRREFFRSRACGSKHRFACIVDLLLQRSGFRSHDLSLFSFDRGGTFQECPLGLDKFREKPATCSDLKSKTPRTEISAFSGRD